jgi:HlyD family secretion protein
MDRKIEKKKWTPKKIIWLSIGGIFAFLILYNLIFGDHSAKFNVQKERISIEEVKEDYFQDYITVTGTVEPISTIFLDAMEGGRVEEIVTEDGTMVKKGDVILRLSNTNLHLEIMNREANLFRNENMKTVKIFLARNLFRTKNLKKKKNIMNICLKHESW